MKKLFMASSFLIFSSCSTLSESIAPVSWGSGAYVAVPVGYTEDVEQKSKGSPARELSSEESKDEKKLVE